VAYAARYAILNLWKICRKFANASPVGSPEASARLFRHRRDGARADAISIWIAQFVGQKINVLDYYEAQGQPLSVHIDWMSSRGWGTAWVILPHDGAYGDKVFATSYESAIREAGFDVLVVPNQGAGAAKARIETPRRHFPRIFFNAETTEPGVMRSAGIMKSDRTMIVTSGSGRTTIGVRAARTASA
jgi:hypothetical protein